MLNLEVCRKVLHKNGKTFNEDEILKIREFLYQMAKVVVGNNPKLKKDEK